jgi:hypothetical protein
LLTREFSIAQNGSESRNDATNNGTDSRTAALSRYGDTGSAAAPEARKGSRWGAYGDAAGGQGEGCSVVAALCVLYGRGTAAVNVSIPCQYQLSGAGVSASAVIVHLLSSCCNTVQLSIVVFPNFCNRVSLPDVTQQAPQQDKDPQDSDGDEPEGVNAAADFDRQMRAELIRVSNTLSLCLRVGYIHCAVPHSHILDVCAL